MQNKQTGLDPRRLAASRKLEICRWAELGLKLCDRFEEKLKGVYTDSSGNTIL